MTIKFNEVTWYSKFAAAIFLLGLLPALVYYISRQYGEVNALREEVKKISNKPASTVIERDDRGGFADPLDGVYTIDEQEIRFVNGASEQEIAPGSAQKMIMRAFGEPVHGDLNADGKEDAIFFVSQETGGTGIFFYVVAALKQGSGYADAGALFLGDRIAPQNIDITGGVAAVNYVARGEDEPMVAQPSKGVTKYVSILGGKLTEKTASASVSGSKFYRTVTKAGDTSNIVGYFAGGSFYWYVPAWVPEGWNLTNRADGNGFTLSPKNSVPDRAFSDIIVAVNPSTESYNAVALFDEDRSSTEGDLIVDEVFLNEHEQGTLQIVMETNTRIYHVQREIDGRIYDRYYLDGTQQGKTAYVTFSAAKDIFPQYEAMIRDFVQGIGAGESPQG